MVNDIIYFSRVCHPFDWYTTDMEERLQEAVEYESEEQGNYR